MYKIEIYISIFLLGIPNVLLTDAENDYLIKFKTLGYRSFDMYAQKPKNLGGKSSIIQRPNIASRNLKYHETQSQSFNDAIYSDYTPGMAAKAFTLPCWSQGGVTSLSYPSDFLRRAVRPSLIFVIYDERSGFSQCLFNCDSGPDALRLSSQLNNTEVLFIAATADSLPTLNSLYKRYHQNLSKLKSSQSSVAYHFIALSLDSLGNWISEVFSQWRCLDHNCGLSQVRLNALNQVQVYPRLDARYDWLPGPETVLGNASLPLVWLDNGCQAPKMKLDGKVAAVAQGGCSYYTKIKMMEAAGAKAVILLSDTTGHIVDMNCNGSECDAQLNIPAASVPAIDSAKWAGNTTISFQTTPGNNLFFAIDYKGLIQEVGWALYPSMDFIAWQAQWFEYKRQLESRVHTTDAVYSIFHDMVMQGPHGAEIFMTMPPLQELQNYSRMHLDTSLSCPGTRDKDCPHWDHTVSLRVCCTSGCQPKLEIGRWITPFRRRIGRWLTDITPLMPMMSGNLCHFSMTTVPWAMAWKPSVSIRLSGSTKAGDLVPNSVLPVYNKDSATFDSKYNQQFQPMSFNVSAAIKKVALYAVITGHGSDENGCGEFCVTSHQFTINGNKTYTTTFSDAGTPLGCANKVPLGVLPNEHGTWLYGRDGWCDGQQVDPWVMELTPDLYPGSKSNTLSYRGTFNGTDPNPKQSPGSMIFASYLIYYKEK